MRSSISLATRALLGAVLGLFALVLPLEAAAGEKSTAAVADRQAYWFGRYNLAFVTMMSGMGPPLPAATLQTWADKLGPAVGLDPRSLPKNSHWPAALYASGDPGLTRPLDMADWATMLWDPATMNRTLTPAAQAYTILKETAKQFHLDYHETPLERWVARAMFEQAKVLGRFLAEKLRNPEGMFVSLDPQGRLGSPTAADQMVVLWAFSSLALLASDPSLPLYHDPDAAARFRDLADQAFVASGQVPLAAMHEQALAIEAYGWYAVTTADNRARGKALAAIPRLAEALVRAPKATVAELAFAVYGLMEASRVTGDFAWERAAQKLFSEDLEALWDPKAGVYATAPGTARYRYDPVTVGAILGALNALRWFGTPGLYATVPARPEPPSPLLAEQRSTAFFETIFLRSGLLTATGVVVVPRRYLDREPIFHFTAPSIPVPAAAGGKLGRAPVYASEVTYADGRWTVTNGRFTTAPAMFLATMSGWLHRSQADGFIPLERLMPRLLAALAP